MDIIAGIFVHQSLTVRGFGVVEVIHLGLAGGRPKETFPTSVILRLGNIGQVPNELPKFVQNVAPKSSAEHMSCQQPKNEAG